ncbi:helix-turn-helix domain-containing protein [Gottfriedia acidiceleris]|uniref:helix-turn-helix domain-containing protein n=1 Tax=Gottfriedia acidiceleris TaxID=371036 RepID=UPI00101B76F6|nr:helix-turn-helix transcriptional regulator [Gottfriedia acidiceleris]
MSELLKMVGDRVRYLRKLKGLTQEELAEKAEVHYTYIGGIERGERNISLETFEKISNALNVLPSVIFHNDKPSFPANDLDREEILKFHKQLLESRNTNEILLIHETVKKIISLLDSK